MRFCICRNILRYINKVTVHNSKWTGYLGLSNMLLQAGTVQALSLEYSPQILPVLNFNTSSGLTKNLLSRGG